MGKKKTKKQRNRKKQNRRKSSRTTTKGGTQHRLYLIEQNQREAVSAYYVAQEQGIGDPVVMVLDLADNMARQCARGCGMSDKDIQDHRQRMHGMGYPTVVACLPRQSAVEFCQISGTPQVAGALSQGPVMGMADVVAISRKSNCLVKVLTGASALHHPSFIN